MRSSDTVEMTGIQLRECGACQYFRQDEYTGFCRLHQAYVLKTFVCDKFRAVESSAQHEGGHDERER